ncbi:DUF2586 domain-containing protein [Vibrio sp. Vb2853]|uniref:DUF2586 domain-containing protein n=1 Tax=unclassified Vibrio TaxID=2614977 RepID=UPI0029647EF2|nr:MULTISPECIES: DUF2586 domain-containing protein [unclassified Vibrio]MDW1615059.1 DUF2586 domain-containing protein [Vibrio sp. Vb2881]MDW1619775.1 DUF2586 domain-containing protein [Vibrio sp. Vb2864]MDW1691909.1 DUF2586 domain-containing protein [Vibrio sp. Vb2853]MDW1710619.1 DUF2586 domain-containing protein [Vibrio sp. Vb2865]MDW1715740.1 DUF2586 domain-containing protein [Vibrio sp. Vb2873]
MAWPTITINALNQNQGPVTEVERHFLFLGTGTKSAGELLSLNTQSDLDKLLDDGVLKDNLIAARVNAGQNWSAAAYVLTAPEDWTQAVKAAQKTQSFEAVVHTVPTTDQSTVTAAQALYHELIATYGRWTFVMLSLPSIESEVQTWSEYEAAMIAVQEGVAADGVMLVPNVLPVAIGKLAGRLCNRLVSIADSPIRVKTGALVGDVTLPVDSTGATLTTATLQTLEKNRMSVPAWFPDYEGIYWADGRMLDVEGGDFQVVEHRRIIDKIARRVRLIAISDVGDRSFNSTPASTARAKLRYTAPLRVMAKGSTVGQVVIPGEIESPTEDAITITWKTKSAVEIYMTAKPKDCPKSITAGLMLDLSNPE